MNGIFCGTLSSVRHFGLLHPRPLIYVLFSSSESDPPSGSSPAPSVKMEDVSNKEFKRRIELYAKGDEEALPLIMKAILKQKLSGKNEDTDEELMDEIRFAPPHEDDRPGDEEFESDFEDLHSIDDEIEHLYSARDIVMDRLRKEEFFNMDDKKWYDIIKEATEKGFLQETKVCEDILEDMLSWDKILPGNGPKNNS